MLMARAIGFTGFTARKGKKLNGKGTSHIQVKPLWKHWQINQTLSYSPESWEPPFLSSPTALVQILTLKSGRNASLHQLAPRIQGTALNPSHTHTPKHGKSLSEHSKLDTGLITWQMLGGWGGTRVCLKSLRIAWSWKVVLKGVKALGKKLIWKSFVWMSGEPRDWALKL